MTRYVAFLRAINTPPRYVKMDRLRAVFEALGLEIVSTFIASGNVIFDTENDSDLVPRIERALEAELGFEVPTFLRTGEEVVAAVDRQPFTDDGSIEVSFLYAEPNSERAREVEATASGNDQLAVIGRELYWWHIGTRDQSAHSEGKVMQILDMLTTQRSLRTVEGIADGFLR